MNLNGAIDELELPVKNDEVYVYNSWTNSTPIVIHGNGPAKVEILLFFFDFYNSILFYREL